MNVLWQQHESPTHPKPDYPAFVSIGFISLKSKHSGNLNNPGMAGHQYLHSLSHIGVLLGWLCSISHITGLVKSHM